MVPGDALDHCLEPRTFAANRALMPRTVGVIMARWTLDLARRWPGTATAVGRSAGVAGLAERVGELGDRGLQDVVEPIEFGLGRLPTQLDLDRELAVRDRHVEAVEHVRGKPGDDELAERVGDGAIDVAAPESAAIQDRCEMAAADDRVRMYWIHHGQALLQDRAGLRQPALMLEEQTESDAGPPYRVVVGAAARLAHRLGQPLLGGFHLADVLQRETPVAQHLTAQLGATDAFRPRVRRLVRAQRRLDIAGVALGHRQANRCHQRVLMSALAVVRREHTLDRLDPPFLVMEVTT